jgi:lipase
VPLHTFEYGDPAGAPLVCLHGVTGHGQRFRRLGQGPLAARRVIAPDLRGHGHSPAAPPWSTATHVADALELVDGLGVDRADWIGFSFGGRVAAALAATAPERVGRLALLDPALQLPVEVCAEQARLELSPQEFGSADEAIEARLAAGTLFHTPREPLEEEMAQHLADVGGGRLRYRYDAPAAIGAWGEMADDPPPVADVPTLFLRGERSWLPLDPHVARYREALGDRLQVAAVPGGHSLLWDAFEATAEVLTGFLGAGPPP